MLGKFSVPGRPTVLENIRARACCSCSGCGLGLFGHFPCRLSFLSSFFFSLGDGLIWSEILSQRPLSPKHPTFGSKEYTKERKKADSMLLSLFVSSNKMRDTCRVQYRWLWQKITE